MLSSSFFRRFDLLQGKFYFHIFGIVFFAFCIVCLYVELLEMTCGIKLMIFLKIILIFVCLHCVRLLTSRCVVTKLRSLTLAERDAHQPALIIEDMKAPERV